MFAEVGVGRVAQRMRWIPPGRFWMGSPEDEPGRFDDEERRDVELAEGFWLGDTPVTQALWEGVMGNNPSRFKTPGRPVEQVSWNDVHAFCAALDARVPGFGARLPTEVEWERACRAGTEGATWLGPLKLRGENNAPGLDPIAGYGGDRGLGSTSRQGRTVGVGLTSSTATPAPAPGR